MAFPAARLTIHCSSEIGDMHIHFPTAAYIDKHNLMELPVSTCLFWVTNVAYEGYDSVHPKLFRSWRCSVPHTIWPIKEMESIYLPLKLVKQDPE